MTITIEQKRILFCEKCKGVWHKVEDACEHAEDVGWVVSWGE